MHELLTRLIERHLPSSDRSEDLNTLLGDISDALEERDQENQVLEQSLHQASERLKDINQELRNKLHETEAYQQQLEETLAKQKALLDTSPEAIISFYPGGKINEINRAGCKLLQSTKEQVKKLTVRENLDTFLGILKDPPSFISELKRLREDNLLVLLGYITTKDNRCFEYNSLPEMLDDIYIGRVWCFRDITDIRKNQKLLQHQAHYDPLTHLPNRNLLLASIKRMISHKKGDDHKVAILFIDLDDFKKINDTAGHEEGDKCLIEVCSRLKKELRQSDVLGRLGGDEFLLIINNISELSRLLNIIDRIIGIFKKPFKIQNHAYVLGASIGICLYPKDGDSAEELIRKADMAMYKAKQKGKNNFYFYDNNLELNALHRVAIENQLREAIKNQELLLHFQPKISLKTGKISGAEALIRWQLPSGKIMYPDNFIHISESTGLIRYITRWVIISACETLELWQKTMLKNMPISVNISAVDFADKVFLEEVFAILDDYKIPPGLLEFELTESIFFDNTDWATHTISQLKSRNIRLAIDDFGTGYSSFGYLQDLDIDYLKIDRGFVRGLNNSKRSLSIVKTIIDIGINLGLTVIAEGVETKEEQECLRKAGCHQGQGFYFSKPITQTELFLFTDKVNRKPYKKKFSLR